MRQRAGMTQRQLAEAVGREQNYVARIETGQRRVDLIELLQICRACGLEPEEEVAKLARKLARLMPPKRSVRGQRPV
jgi:transcriptional regulator with XRE-family HTH domain